MPLNSLIQNEVISEWTLLGYAFANQIGFFLRPTQALDTQVSRQKVVTLEMPTISGLLLPQVLCGNQGDVDLVKT